MNFAPIKYDQHSLNNYSSLFSACFPNAAKFNFEYLNWLYCNNPNGKAIGFDAWDGDQLAAHYVCIPSVFNISGQKLKLLLSLNTATHPKYQGKGLFTRLAEMTYIAAANTGFDGIYGVANANSTPGFVKKLGFQLIAPLEAKVGFGKLHIDLKNSNDSNLFQRIWTHRDLKWRCSNPNNTIYSKQESGCIEFSANAICGRFLPAYAELSALDFSDIETLLRRAIFPMRLYIGLTPTGSCSYKNYYNIPQRFRPSPLNFIYRALSQNTMVPEYGKINISFLDFDAY
jgi:hypothetical protein